MYSVSRFLYRFLCALSFLRSSFAFCNESITPIYGSESGVCSSGKSRMCNIRHDMGCSVVWNDIVCELRTYLVTCSAAQHRNVLLVCYRLLAMAPCLRRCDLKPAPQQRPLKRPVLWPEVLPCSIIRTRFPGRSVIGNGAVQKCDTVVGVTGIVKKMPNFNWETKIVLKTKWCWDTVPFL